MANIMDYLDWRGDLSFEQAPFNEVDNLLCSFLSYVPLDGLIKKKEVKTLSEISREYWEEQDEKALLASNSVVKLAPLVMRKMASSRRFSACMISDYVSHYNQDTGKQFGALTIQIKDQLFYVSFRGTDDAMLGWYEDFCMAYMIVPAQREAKLYLERLARQHQGMFMVGGHSKGGNLAIYAATFAKKPVQDRLVWIYNNDGPGFCKGFLDEEKFQIIRERIQTFVPKSSIVGMLLEQSWDYKIVENKKAGIAQHDMFTWELLGDHMLYAEELTRDSILLKNSVSNWLSSMDLEERKNTIQEMYDTLIEAEVYSVTDLDDGKVKKIWHLVESMRSHPKTRDAMVTVLKCLFEEKMHMTFHKK